MNIPFLIANIVIFLINFGFFLYLNKKRVDGKFLVDTEQDIYRIVLNDLLRTGRQQYVVLKVEHRRLSSLREDQDVRKEA